MSATLPPLERFETAACTVLPVSEDPARQELWTLLRSTKTGKVVRMIRVG